MSLFVPVNEPDAVRKELLSGSKLILNALRRYESYRHLRKQKMELMNQLAGEWNDLNKLMRKLKMALPKTDIKVQMPSVRPMIQHEDAQGAPKVEKQTRSKVDILESQLQKIESRLAQLQ